MTDAGTLMRMESSQSIELESPDEEFAETSFTIDTLVQFEAEFVGIDRAITALQTGTYGSCEVCDVTIASDRLRSDPVLVRCDAHIVRATPALFSTDDEPEASEEASSAGADGLLFVERVEAGAEPGAQ